MRQQSRLVIYDGCEPCPYVPGRTARMPIEWFGPRVGPERLDRLLAEGYRRSGRFYYRLQCPACRACQAVRVSPQRFRPSSTQRRIWRRMAHQIRIEIGVPQLDEVRLELFNRHRLERNLGREPFTTTEYHAFLVDTTCPTMEVDFYKGERLVAVAITDVGARSWSAVYCYFDPDESAWSPGVFAILAQLDLACRRQIDYLYLGLYAEDAVHLCYKAHYHPQERLQDGRWLLVP
ncbi:MAG: putative arginyl-tRNA--protein transferase [Pirellulaceae bacterium]|nr:MAG: putative arginyl-tRNA--protein transferase [Pirellulaceae bacterium]